MTSYPSAPPPGQSDGPAPYGTPPAPSQGGPGGARGAGAYGPHDAAPQVGRQPWSPPPSAGPSGAPPVCPRHPDRVSYVTCQRCGRPVCPQCQRSAAVGVHCVDCVSQANRSTRSRVTVFGAKVRPGARPVVTITIIAICVALFLLDLAGFDTYSRFAYSPAAGRVEPWRMLTAAFLHASLMHIAFNMLALWFTGPFLEQALGRARFLALYLVSALGGSVAVLLLTPADDWFRGVVGASGAVFGLFGAVAIVMIRLKKPSTQIFGVIAINLVLTFLIPNISWQGHLGGLLTGAAIGALYAYLPKKAQGWGAVVGVGAITAALILATVLRYAAA